MRETLDCAVLMTPAHAAWVRDWIDSHRGQLGRLRLYAQDFSSLVSRAPDMSLSSPGQLALRRFDGCILPVAPTSLSWTRTLLADPGTRLCVPLIALLFDISAPATLDLLSLGVTDFVRAPACPNELRARLLHSNRQARSAASASAAPTMLSGMFPISGRYSVDRATRPYGRQADYTSQNLALAGQARSMPERASTPAMAPVVDADFLDLRSTDEPFRQAKARVVDGFERAYLRGALYRHSGNVAQAARASCKHRRAFWALMRKHQIDAAHYRINDDFPESSF